MDFWEMFKLALNSIILPVTIYFFSQISKSKDERARLHDELTEFKIYCANNYVKNKDIELIRENIQSLRKEIKDDFQELKKELKEYAK